MVVVFLSFHQSEELSVSNHSQIYSKVTVSESYIQVFSGCVCQSISVV